MAQLQAATSVPQSPSMSTPLSASSLMTHTEKYSGNPAEFKGFMLQCSLYFASQEGVPECTKIVQLINLINNKVPSCLHEPHPLVTIFTHDLPNKPKLWRNISKKPSNRGTVYMPLHISSLCRFLLCGEKSTGLWPYIDSQGLNKVTIMYHHPLPWKQQPLNSYRRPKSYAAHTTWFVSMKGIRLSSVPAVFQCLISDVLWDMLGKFVIAYIDNILI